MCQKLARSLQQLTTEEERGLFDFGARHGETAPLVSLALLPEGGTDFTLRLSGLTSGGSCWVCDDKAKVSILLACRCSATVDSGLCL